MSYRGRRRRRYRLPAACAIVIALLASILLADGILKAADSGPDDPGLSIRMPADAARQDPFGVLERLEQQMAATEAPSGEADLLQAIEVLPKARDLRIDEGGCTAGYTVEGSEGEVLASLEEAMGLRGWSAVPLGGPTGSTFLGGEGPYEILVATCTQVGGDVSVVFRAVRR